MRMRLGVPLLAAVAGLLGAVQSADAGHCGAASCTPSCCNNQCCFTSCFQRCRPSYKLCYDKVLERRPGITGGFAVTTLGSTPHLPDR